MKLKLYKNRVNHLKAKAPCKSQAFVLMNNECCLKGYNKIPIEDVYEVKDVSIEN